MPELPEVEVIVRTLAGLLPGQCIRAVSGRLRGRVASAVGASFSGVRRRGKFIAGGLHDGRTLLVHLGMSGRLVLEHDEDVNDRHTRLLVEVDSGRLRYSDPRRFGRVRLCPGEPEELLRLGPEPLGDELCGEALAERIERTRRTIKDALLDQRLVAGLGNIYVCEALFLAGIDPRRRAHTLDRPSFGRLLEAMRDVLRGAIERRGTTLSDTRFVGADGRVGENFAALAVYGRGGKPCGRCGATIVRVIQGNRSSFLCPRCQG